MELDARELFCYLARDCNYRDEKLCGVSKVDCIARHYILLSKLRISWRFLKFSEALQVYSNRNFYVRNHVSQKAKGEISNWDAIYISRIEKHQFRYISSNVFFLRIGVIVGLCNARNMQSFKQNAWKPVFANFWGLDLWKKLQLYRTHVYFCRLDKQLNTVLTIERAW